MGEKEWRSTEGNTNIRLMHKYFGTSPSRCGECSNLSRSCCGRRTLYKCKVYGDTSSEATDWAKSWPACGMFNREYSGPPMMGASVGRSAPQPEPEEPLDGQMEWKELIQ